jgi:tRNA U34 2-thiouridine synthase MnmA/TrmU
VARAIVLFSGGLDSQLATRLIQNQGVEVLAITSASVFHHEGPELGPDHPAARYAERLGVRHRLLDTNAEMLDLVLRPQFGRGKNMNPCIDCRMLLLRKAGELMRDEGFDFVATGEVLGQRPMSQRRDPMTRIVRDAALDGLVLRPLCAKRLPPTIPEERGWVDREQLKGFSGRTRKPQMALAEELGITDYPAPAGGCLLTDPGFAMRLSELLDHEEPTLNDVELLRLGRHFRIAHDTKVVMGRDQAENEAIERLSRARDVLLDAAEHTGPTALMRGRITTRNVETAAGLTLKYGKGRDEPEAPVVLRRAKSQKRTMVTIEPASLDLVQDLIISRDEPGGRTRPSE